jgi:hypothetical protein
VIHHHDAFMTPDSPVSGMLSPALQSGWLPGANGHAILLLPKRAAQEKHSEQHQLQSRRS